VLLSNLKTIYNVELTDNVMHKEIGVNYAIYRTRR